MSGDTDRLAQCIGFGEHEGTCENEAGSSHSELWCQRCDDLRLEHIGKRFAEISKSFAALSALDGDAP